MSLCMHVCVYVCMCMCMCELCGRECLELWF